MYSTIQARSLPPTEKVEEELNSLLAQDIIEKVEGEETQ